MPYIVQWEQENSYKCLFRQQRTDGLYFKGNPAVLLRGDDKSRAEFLTTMIQNGMLNPDEAGPWRSGRLSPAAGGRRSSSQKTWAPWSPWRKESRQMVDISIRGELWDDDSADVLRWWGFRDITAPMDIRTALSPPAGTR